MICQHRKRIPYSHVWMWTCTSFGRGFVAEPDHKPLESIQMKNSKECYSNYSHMIMSRLTNACDRCPSKALLWWSYAHTRSECSSAWSMPTIFKWIQYLPKLQEKTAKDPELAALKEVVFNGWPNTIKELPPVLRPYWNYWEELSNEDRLIMKRHKCYKETF